MVDKNLYNYRVDRIGSITTAPETKQHPDLKEMSIRKVKDLYNWGYRAFAQDLAVEVLIKYGCEEDMLDIIKGGHTTGLSLKRKVMLAMLRISPTLFDAICIATGRRVKW